MNCQEALDLLYDIIDKEASEIDVREVEKHLNECRDCMRKYRLVESMQSLICEKLKKDESASKIDQLKSKILNSLDQIDSGPPAKENPRPFRLSATILVVAASLIIVLGAMYWGNTLSDHQELYIPLERAHWAVMNGESSLADNSATQQALSFASAEYSYDLDPTVGEFRLVGGTSETVDGVEMVHFLYTNDGSAVSVFVAPVTNFAIPFDDKVEEKIRHDRSFFDHNCRGCRLVFHRDGESVIITATTDRTVELLDFLPGHSSI